MREIRQSGSEGGVAGNGHPYPYLGAWSAHADRSEIGPYLGAGSSHADRSEIGPYLGAGSAHADRSEIGPYLGATLTIPAGGTVGHFGGGREWLRTLMC